MEPSPAPAALLPAPLYLLQSGQIARVERDATTRAVLTAERVALPDLPAIAEFAVSPSGELAYVVGDREADRLVLADARGENPRTLYEQPGHELSDLAWSPDGSYLALRLLNNREPPDIPGGLYRIAPAGGALELVRADDAVDNPVTPARTVNGYRPVAYSPDGARLLVEAFSLFYEDCGLALLPASGGEPILVVLPAGTVVTCGEAAWSADGASFLFLAGVAEGADAGPQLWRGDAATGAAQPLQALPAYARAPGAGLGAAARFFLVALTRDAAGTITGASFTPAELAAAGTTPVALGPAANDRLVRALWAPDGTGVVAAFSVNETGSELRWQPVGGEPVIIPGASDDPAGLAWGVE